MFVNPLNGIFLDDTEENALEINEDPMEEVETIETTTDNIDMACQEVLQDDQPLGISRLLILGTFYHKLLYCNSLDLFVVYCNNPPFQILPRINKNFSKQYIL